MDVPLRMLATTEVDVWLVAVDSATFSVARQWLSVDERIRTTRLRRREDRMRFAITRAALRTLLGAYLGMSPHACLFEETQYGKPFLANSIGGGVDFNVSHSGLYGLLAFTNGRPVGVDIEECCPTVDYDAVASRAFSPGEQVGLTAAPAEFRRQEFFRFWTRKEAYLKCLGYGFGSTSPERITATPCTDPTISIRSLSIADGYAAAVATTGLTCQLTLRTFRV